MNIACLALVAGVAAVDLSALSAAQRAAFREVASEQFCSCDSALTLAGCLEARPQCTLATHLAQLVVKGLTTGATADEVLAFLSRQVVGPMCGPQTPLRIDGAPSSGPSDAPITLVEFADFRCGHCKQAAPMVHQALERWGTKVRFVFMPFPLRDHPQSVAAAEALLAAGAQGKLWPMHAALFAYPGTDYTLDTLKKIAKTVGLDGKTFAQQLQDHTFRPQVEALKAQGMNANIEGTPTFFVNGRRFEPDAMLCSFADRFEIELDRAHARNCQ